MPLLYTLKDLPNIGDSISKIEIIVNPPIKRNIGIFIQIISANLYFNDKVINVNLDFYNITNNREIIPNTYSYEEFFIILDDIENNRYGKNLRQFIV